MLKLFLLATVLTVSYSFVPHDNVKVTGYCPGPPCVKAKWADGITAANTKAKHGVCAADWKVFPKGTVFFIPHYGKCRVEDTGNGVKGRHLDLYFDSYDEARKWGLQYIRVYWMGVESVH